MFIHLFHAVQTIKIEHWIFSAVIFVCMMISFRILDKKGKISDHIGRAMLGTYVYLVIYGTVLSRNLGIAYRYNIDAVSIVQAIIKGEFSIQLEVASNVIFFVPIGFLIPLGFFTYNLLSKRNCLKICRLGFVLSFGIELVQFFTGLGLFELTDILSNVIGILIGWSLFVISYSLVRTLSKLLVEKE